MSVKIPLLSGVAPTMQSGETGCVLSNGIAILLYRFDAIAWAMFKQHSMNTLQ